MNIRTRIAAIVAATAGVVGFTALAVTTPAVADVVTHPFSWVSDGQGNGQGNGPRNGQGNGAGSGSGSGSGRGNGQGPGNGDREAGTEITAQQGTLTDAQRAALAAMAQDEKLAHDVYQAMADKYDVRVFERISGSESQHLSTVRTLLDRYGVSDPTAGQAAGRFSDAAVQATYDRLLADGSKDVNAAYKVGTAVEQLDIDDLQRALDGLTTAPDVQQVYTNLTSASRQHLSTFESWATR